MAEPSISPATVDLYRWPAPAKLNLFLHVTGRRPDGYHRLQTVFQFLDYGDALSFRVREDGRIRLRTPLPGVDPDRDLTVRSARLLQRQGAAPLGVDIYIEKRLPMGGGLGGGSSDAATTLQALNRLWGLGLDRRELMALGLALGADVPVFVYGRAAFAEGVGERLAAVDPTEPWYVVVDPGVQVETAAIFAAPELTRNCPEITIDGFLSGQGYSNVCEPVVRRRFPQVGAALDWLAAHAPASMTGTGACIFAPCPDRAAAEAIARAVPTGRWRAFVAKGCNRSPLESFLGEGASAGVTPEEE